MHDHDRADARRDRQHGGEQRENQHFIVDWRGLSGVVLFARAGRSGAGRCADNGHLQRHDQKQMQPRIDKAGRAPAGMLDHEGAERPADGAGKSAEQREIGDRRARLAAVHASERGENRVVKAGAHAEADQHPGGEIHRQRWRSADTGKPRRIAKRAREQHRPPPAFVDDAADLRGNQAGNQKPERGAGDHVAERPAGFGDDRLGKHRRKIERGAPGQDLANAQRRDDDAAIERPLQC